MQPKAPPGDGDHGPAPLSLAASVQARVAHILVVDDVEVNRRLVKAMLSAHQHQLTEAASGAEAVQKAAQARFDLILMDLQMPGMDGITAARLIRANGGPNVQTPIVALSADVLPSQLEACRQAGLDDHIGKPISLGELLTKVGRWTGPGSA
jgi:CheY-like chemotaxis protein